MIVSSKLAPANKNDNIVLTARVIINIFITLSSVLYFPIIKSKNEKNKIIRVQTSMESILPKIEFAIPAVTIVTAVCIVNIVPRVITKNIIGIIGCNFRYPCKTLSFVAILYFGANLKKGYFSKIAIKSAHIKPNPNSAPALVD